MLTAFYLRNPLLRSGLNPNLPSLVTRSLIRNLSSKTPNNAVMVETQISANVAKNLHEAIGSFYEKLPSNTIIRKSSHVELAKWIKYLSPILQQDRQLYEQLNFLEKAKPPIFFIKGLNFPNLTAEEIPSHARDLSNPEFVRKAKYAEIITALIFDRIGIKLDLPFTYVYASKEEIDTPGSYKSSRKDLGWHSDGWKNGQPDYVGLLCLAAIEEASSALTQIITSKQIIDYFKTRGDEKTLKNLSSYYLMGGIYEDRDMILEGEKIRYAEYGEILGNEEAILALNKCLQELSPTFSKVLKSGDLLICANTKSLHRRTSDPSATPQAFDGKRVLLRSNATEIE